MTVFVNRAWMSTATVGAGTITLGSALSGYQTFADAGIANADTVRYTIIDGANWEIGTGTYTSAGTTLTRTVSESSNADAAINLSGSASVFLTVAAADLAYLSGAVFTGAIQVTTVEVGHASDSTLSREAAGFLAIEGRVITTALDRDVTVTDVNTTVTETTVYTFSVPGGTLGSTRLIRISFFSDYLNNSGGASNLTLRFKYGATTFGTFTFSAIASNAVRRIITPFGGGVSLSAENATNAQISGGAIALSGNVAIDGAASGAGADYQFSGHATIAEDSTAAKTLAITAEHSVSNAAISFRIHWVQVEVF